MDYGTITLAFIALLVLYIIYTFFFMSSHLIGNPVDLKLATGANELTYESTKLKNPGSTRYYYEAWLYIDTNPVGTNNVLFHRGKFFLALNGSSLRIYTQVADGSALGDIGASASDDYGANVYSIASSKPLVTITDTFPFQKWVQVVVSVDGNSVDIYLEGQLVQTISANFGNSAELKAGDLGACNGVTVGKLKDFVYKPTVISPQEVYNSYMSKNSLAGLGGFFSKYGIDMSLLKNNENLFEINLL
jgi:hypothetical protein